MLQGRDAAWNATNHELPPAININVDINALAWPDSPVNIPQSPDKFLQSILPNECHILSVEPDSNCLFCSILDQLYHDNGAIHDFTRHQITNHISRNGKAFKNSSCFKTIMRTFPALKVTSVKWGRTVHGGVTQRCTWRHGFMASTFLFMHKSMPILVDFLCSKGIAQRTIVVIPSAQCGPYHIRVTTITTASVHPGAHLVPLTTS